MLVGTALNYNVDCDTGEIIPACNDITYEQRMEDLQKAEQAEERERAEQKKSPFKHFAQFNVDHCKDWQKLIRKSPTAAEILMFFLEHIDNYNALVCSSKVIEEALGMSRATISRSIKLLRETGFVDVKKSGTTNVYLINKDLVWKSWGKNYKYAEFDAKIIIAESEQEQEQEETQTKRINMVVVKE